MKVIIVANEFAVPNEALAFIDVVDADAEFVIQSYIVRRAGGAEVLNPAQFVLASMWGDVLATEKALIAKRLLEESAVAQAALAEEAARLDAGKAAEIEALKAQVAKLKGE